METEEGQEQKDLLCPTALQEATVQVIFLPHSDDNCVFAFTVWI